MKTVVFSSGSNTRGPVDAVTICRPHTLASRVAYSSGLDDDTITHNRPSNACGSLDSAHARSLSATISAQQHHHHHRRRMYRMNHETVLLVFYIATAIAFCVIPAGSAGIDCFKCVSLNGDNPSCEDPFHNNYSVSILESPCMGGRKGREGLFPATACIKLAGKYDDTGESMVVRTCAVDSGTLTLDTELARMSHCGFFYFDDRYVKGCLQSCDDADGCNGSPRPNHFSGCTTILLLLITSIGLPAYLLTSRTYRFHFGNSIL